MARQTNINVNVNTTSAVKSINVLKKAFVDLNKTIQQTTNNGKIKLDIDFGNIDIGMLNNIIKSLNKMNKAISNLTVSTNAFAQNGRVFNITSNTIIRSTRNMSNEASDASSNIINMVIALESWRRGLSNLMGTYKEISSSMFSIGVADQMTLAQIDKLNSSFMALSSTVPHSVASLATAVNDLIRTGRSYDESRKIIEQVALLSTASGDSLQDTAKVVTKVMTALDISADKTRETLNSMHSTAIRTASDMGYLAESFKNVAGTASVLVKSSGLSGEELDSYKQKVLDLTNSISGSFANIGLSASQSGTKTKVLFSKLVAMEKTAKTLFDQSMRLNDVRVGGELFDSDKLSSLAKTDLPKAVQLISELYTQGKLSSQVLQKMFTGRHFMDIGEILVQINGNVDNFIDGIAKGVNYSSDFYKKMFDINEQVKQLSVNFSNILQSGFGIGESVNGLAIALNESLVKNTSKVEENTHTILKNLSGMSFSAVSFGLSTAVLLRYFEKIAKFLFQGKIALTPWVALASAVGAGFHFAGKYLYDLNKGFADTSINLDNINLKLSNTSKNLRNAESYLAHINLTLKDVDTKELVQEHTLGILELMTKGMTEFNNVMNSMPEMKLIDEKIIRKNLEDVNKELNNVLDDLTKKKDEFQKELDKDLTKLSYTHLSKGGMEQQVGLKNILETYIKLKQEGEDIQKINETIFSMSKKMGISKHNVKSAIRDLNTEKIQEISKKILEIEEESIKISNKVKDSFDNTYKSISKNKELMSNLIALSTQTKYEIFKQTGEYKDLKGVDAIKKIYDESHLEVFSNKIKELKSEIKSETLELENMYSAIKRGDTSITQNDIKEKIKNVNQLTRSYNMTKIEMEKQKELLNNMNLEGLEGIDINEKNYQIVLEILHITAQLNMEKSKMGLGQSYDPNLIQHYEKWLEDEKKLLSIIQNKVLEQEKATKYQIKYRNYLKETLDIELESLKLGKTKQEQEMFIYAYKLKQLKLEKEVADAEKETAKQSFKNVNVSQKWLDKVNSITDTKSGQDVIKEFIAQYKNVLEGKEGKELKNFYETLTTYVSAISKSENLGDKITLEPLKAVNSFLLEVPNSVKISLEALNNLANNGVIPFDGYGQKILEQIKKDLEKNKDKIYKSFGIDSKVEIEKAIKDSINEINIVDELIGDDKKVDDYLKKLKVKFKNNKDILEEINLIDNSKIPLKEKEALITKIILSENKALLELQSKYIDEEKQELELLKEKLKYLNQASKLLSLTGDIFGIGNLSEIGKALDSIGDFQINMKEIGKIDWSNLFDDEKQNLSKAIQSAFEGMNLGNIIGTAIGGITGGGIASQQGGALFGTVGSLLQGAGMLSGAGAIGMAVGGSLLGGLFGGKDDKAEAERRTKESNKLYNKNTEALQKLAQNMSNLSGGVDSLNNTLISAVSKIPTLDNINNVTNAMTNMYKTMEKTRKFNDVAYQVTKTKKKKGFLGIGGGSTSWTETIEISVNEMLRRYGFQGALEDMTSQQIRDFSKWLDEYDLGDSDNFSILADALEDYAEGLDKFDKNIQNFFRDSTMEAFSGISSLEQESLRQQIEDFYKNLGFQIDEETSKQIDKIAEEMSVMVTIMSDVRGEFLNQWRETGQSAGSVFLKAMTPYIDAMLGNISQIYYDVYFSGINESLEKEFKELSEQLVELKKQGKDLNWSSVTDKLSSSFDKILTSIITAKQETDSFNDVLLELQKRALESGLSLSEIFDLGLMSGTQKDVMDSFKEALTSNETNGALVSIGSMLGDKIGETMANKMIDNLLSDRVLEFSAQIDKIMSGNLSFDAIAELSNKALSVGLMMQAETDRLSAIKELFNFNSDIEYTTQNENVTLDSGVSQSVTNIYNISSSVEAGNVIESDNIERLADSLLDILLEKLRVDKGITLK